jgi:hypothetical protein
MLSNVRHLKIAGNGSRRLLPRSAPDLAISLPGLTRVEWDLQDCEAEPDNESTDRDSLDLDSDSESDTMSSPGSPKVRGENRVAFLDGLRKTQFQSLSSAIITIYHKTPTDQRRTCPSIVPAGFTYDPFSATLRNLSQNLTDLTLSERLDSTLFWPSPDEQYAVPPFWPHLNSLDVTFNMVAPSGAWYFKEPWDPRTHPDPQNFHPFVTAFAKAVAKMPVLEYFMLLSEPEEDTGAFCISYHAPGEEAQWFCEGPEDVACRRIYYACGVDKIWVPEPEIAEGLRGAGRETFGGEVIERYLGGRQY